MLQTVSMHKYLQDSHKICAELTEFEFLIQLILGLNTLRGLKNTNSLQLRLQCLPA